MKKIFYVAFVAFVTLATLVACGDSKEKKSVTVDGKEVVVSQEVAALDLQGISDLVKKNSDDVTSSDYDFVIDQLEILSKKTGKMSEEEFKLWSDSLISDDQGVVMALGMMGTGMLKRGELSDEQRARLVKVMEELDKK